MKIPWQNWKWLNIIAAGLLLGCLGCSESQGPAACDEACLRAELGIPPEAKQVLIFSQSAHFDWDWVKTFEDYYQSWVGPILSAAHDWLLAAPRNFYSVSEIDFLERHLQAHPEQIPDFVSLAEAGRLRLVGCGMTSPDSLLPAGESILRDYAYGRAKARALLGDKALAAHPPVAAWLPDDFGHSPTMPTLLNEAGFRYVAFARLPGADTEARFMAFDKPVPGSVARQVVDNGWLDFIWRAPDGSQIQAHYLYPNYGIGDTLDNGLTIPGLPGTDFNGQNTSVDYVHGQIRRYQDLIGSASPTPYVFVPVGNDFQFPKPKLVWLLDRWNQIEYPATGVWAVAATFEHYERLVEFHRSELPVLDLDGTPYFTGFYATKPELKTLHHQADFLLRAAESFRLLAPETVSPWEVDALWRKLVPSNHHDFIPGTASDEVYQGEQLPMLQDAAASAASALAKVEAAVSQKIDTSGDGIPVVVFNGLGLPQGGPVELRGITPPSGDLAATGADGTSSPVQVLQDDGSGQGLLFWAGGVPGLGYQCFHLGAATSPPATPVLAEVQSDGRIRLANGVVDLIIDTGGVVSLKVDGQELLAADGKADALAFFFDDGGLYRLGAELLAEGCAYREEELPQTATPVVEILEQGPVRATARITTQVEGLDFSREVSLLAGERMVRFRTSGTAPEHTTVTVRYDLAAELAEAEMGAPFGVVRRSLAGPWPEYYHPAQAFFAPLGAFDAGFVSFSSKGSLAWKAEPGGRVEHIILRDARTERCDTYGPESRDDQPHTFEYAAFFPDDPRAIVSRALPGYRFQHPLQAVTATAHQGKLPPTGGLFSTAGEGAFITVASESGRAIGLRVFRIDRSLPLLSISPGLVDFRQAWASDLFFDQGEELRILGGAFSAPLKRDLATFLVQ